MDKFCVQNERHRQSHGDQLSELIGRTESRFKIPEDRLRHQHGRHFITSVTDIN